MADPTSSQQRSEPEQQHQPQSRTIPWRGVPGNWDVSPRRDTQRAGTTADKQHKR
jgi:hypothetical protein